MTETEERLQALLTEQLGEDPATNFDGGDWTAARLHDLGADSLDAIELTMAIEEEFAIEITDAEANPFIPENEVKLGEPISGLVALIDAKLAAKVKV